VAFSLFKVKFFSFSLSLFIIIGEGDETIYADLDMENVETVRQNIPCWSQKRNDIYEIIDKTNLE
jgi:predicted amidohydrolase